MKPAEIRKALVAAATFLASLIAQGVIPEQYVPYVLGLLAVLGTYGVWAVPNAQAPAERVEGEHRADV